MAENEVLKAQEAVQEGKMEFRLINPTEDGFLRRIQWNKEELEGPMIENMATVLRKKEDDDDGFVIDKVCDNEHVLEEANALFRESNDRRMNVSSISMGVSKAYVSECMENRQKCMNDD